MLKPRIPKNLPPRPKRTREGDSKAHLAFVRSLPCCVCGDANTLRAHHAHHLLKADDLPKGMGRKNLDRWSLPLCTVCHAQLHGHGSEEWLAQHGIDARALAARLWAISGDYEQGLRVVARCRRVERVA